MSAPIVQSRYPDLDALAARFAQQGEQVRSLMQQVAQSVEVLRSDTRIKEYVFGNQEF